MILVKLLEAQIRSDIDRAMKELDRLHGHLIDANKNGRQLDYVTHPNVSNEMDKIVKKVEVLRKIMYQEYGGY